jgi:glycosyltransferase involved in cell wall biosynthesis
MEVPNISIVIPMYYMEDCIRLSRRNLDSILKQRFTDYEIIVTDDSEDDVLEQWLKDYPVKYYRNPGNKGMANNTNFAIDQARGDLIKVLFQDDYFYDEYSLQDIVRYFTSTDNWLVSACTHSFDGKETFNDHQPYYSYSANTIGSPSVLTFRSGVRERFDPQFHWVLDLDLYRRLFARYGRPKILPEINVVIGIHNGQMTNKLSDERKRLEFDLLKRKYE